METYFSFFLSFSLHKVSKYRPIRDDAVVKKQDFDKLTTNNGKKSKTPSRCSEISKRGPKKWGIQSRPKLRRLLKIARKQLKQTPRTIASHLNKTQSDV